MIIQNMVNAGGLPNPNTVPSGLVSSNGTISSQVGSQISSGATNTTAPNAGQVQRAVSALNQSVSFLNRDLNFSVDQSTHSTVVTVVEAQTGQVITQIPSKQALAIAQAIDALPQRGALLSQKA